MPDVSSTPWRAWEIVREVARIVTSAASDATKELVDRVDLVRVASDSIEGLIDEYFDVLPSEKVVVNDTVRVIIPSARPTRKRPVVPTIDPSKEPQRDGYVNQLCETLNGWAKSGSYVVQGHASASAKLGIGVAILQKVRIGGWLPRHQRTWAICFLRCIVCVISRHRS